MTAKDEAIKYARWARSHLKEAALRTRLDDMELAAVQLDQAALCLEKLAELIELMQFGDDFAI